MLSTDVSRDKEHYYLAGDSIIRVENTLFKIHKAFLSHNSPLFATLFDLPVGTGNPEGSSDALPIFLEGDTADDFRALLKYIYAPPIQVQLSEITLVAVPELVSVAKLSHKYQMDHWRDWALKGLERHISSFDSLPARHIPALYSLANLLGLIVTRLVAIKRWCDVVEQDDLSIVPLINTFDASGDQYGLVAIYCVQIRRWEHSARTVSDLESLPRDGVSSTHFHRMLSGYALLLRSWYRFPS
ncbi:BTB domain-containing protein [Mycena sanguinolenta]|uniref:BTB domain-containing protein n=1 Tax=Mycena sanguinolenta TaxID=230812 RepID=A0A8H6YTQ3_9AGAR|nr:BTB domain-containing protein [Mycena sanguinolenta]